MRIQPFAPLRIVVGKTVPCIPDINLQMGVDWITLRNQLGDLVSLRHFRHPLRPSFLAEHQAFLTSISDWRFSSLTF
jgi:hypothetical protein